MAESTEAAGCQLGQADEIAVEIGLVDLGTTFSETGPSINTVVYMLELISQLLALSFAARLCNSGAAPLPRVTMAYLALFSLVGCACAVGWLPSDMLSLDDEAIREELQLWRLLSAFFSCGGVGVGFVLQLWLFSVYSAMLERRHYAGAEARYALTLLAGATQLALLSFAVGSGGTSLSLAHALSFYVLGLWSRSEPQRLFSLFTSGPVVRAAFVPWGLLGVCLPLTGSVAAVYNVLGLGSALLTELALGLPPALSEATKAPTAAAQAAGTPTTARRSPSANPKPPSGSRAAPGAPPGKLGGGKASWGLSGVRGLSGVSRERLVGWGHVLLTLLLVLYHASGTRNAERRAERSPEMRTCRKLRDAMDASAAPLSSLLSKMADARSSSAAAADAGTILTAWSFAVEHWQQAHAQALSTTPIHNMSAADPEATRQAIAQVLGRTELPEGQSDSEVVAELYHLLGFGRLVVTAESTAPFMAAVHAHKAHRARTTDAWDAIKAFVRESDLPEPPPAEKLLEASEVYAAINTSLAEYDLPTHMTDASVLSELLVLLELPRDAVSYRAERALLAAIRHHRQERATITSVTLASGVAMLLAAATNDSSILDGKLDAQGKPLALPLEHVWSVEACNETTHTLMSEALQLMEAAADEPDVAVWNRLLTLANLTADVVSKHSLGLVLTDVPAAEGDILGLPLLRTAYNAVRTRRMAEARVQASFEELLATVRAEDPTLAAEEAKKAATVEKYEARRIEWLRDLLRLATARGMTPPAEAADAVAAALEEVTPAAPAAAAELAAEEAAAGGGAEAVSLGEEQYEGTELSAEAMATWAEEVRSLRAKRRTSALSQRSAEFLKETAKHEHYARLLKLPRLIDATLANSIDPNEDLSDKQLFHELLRMMGLPDTVEPRLMRAMVEAVKQHRLRREREEIEKGDWADAGAEDLSLRPTWRTANPPSLRRVSSMVNHAGDGSDFALFVATVLQSIGAHVRLSLGCSKNVTIQPPPPDGPPWEVAAHLASLGAEGTRVEPVSACQLAAEVRLGKTPSKIATWVRTWLAGSRWLGKAYKYRLDRDGYAWLNLDWIDSAKLQRPGAPLKNFDSQTIYYPKTLTWEIEGEATDSLGQPKVLHSPVETLQMGVR